MKLDMALVCYLACRCADVIGAEYISMRYSRAVISTIDSATGRVIGKENAKGNLGEA